jgi:hypothetical protein
MIKFKEVQENNIKNLEAFIDSGLIEYCPIDDGPIEIPFSHFPYSILNYTKLLEVMNKLGYNKEYVIEIISDDPGKHRFLKFTPIIKEELE